MPLLCPRVLPTALWVHHPFGVLAVLGFPRTAVCLDLVDPRSIILRVCPPRLILLRLPLLFQLRVLRRFLSIVPLHHYLPFHLLTLLRLRLILWPQRFLGSINPHLFLHHLMLLIHQNLVLSSFHMQQFIHRMLLERSLHHALLRLRFLLHLFFLLLNLLFCCLRHLSLLQQLQVHLSHCWLLRCCFLAFLLLLHISWHTGFKSRSAEVERSTVVAAESAWLGAACRDLGLAARLWRCFHAGGDLQYEPPKVRSPRPA
mmetsp:Transcript_84340/g.273034  ORF Transcript_84340/g.273034 Transcript_84340/m.273034 type:complete len:258 (+) Transcript_84340:564-1337(+)